MPIKKLSISDRVRINPRSEVADGTPSNPLNLPGTIVHIGNDNYSIVVEWDNGYSNDYHQSELIKISNPGN
jgi:hypothetical protein